MASNYWAKRTQQRLVSAEQMSIPAMRGTLAIYERALKNINKEINALYQKYSTETGLDVSELSQIITGAEKRNFLINVQKKMIKLGFKLEDIYIS